MTVEETEGRARELYEAARGDFDPEVGQIPWPDLPEFQKNYWRELARGNAGAVGEEP